MVTKEAVLNLPKVNEVRAVNLLARTTGSNPVLKSKMLKGYRFEENKFEITGLTGIPSETINAYRVNECPVQMEAVVMAIHKLAEDEPSQQGKIITFELKVNRVYLDKSIIPDKWKPLIMSFQEFYTLGDKVHESTLAEIPENLYSTYDRESAQEKFIEYY